LLAGIGDALQDMRAQPRHGALLIALVVVHLLVGADMGLSVDEAHYLLYAQHPALSYFDHPPLVGWLQWSLVAIDAPVGVLRVLPCMLWVGTVLVVYRLANRLQGHGRFSRAGDAGLWSLLALALAPLLHVLGLGLVPDTLLMFFAVLIMAQTWRLMEAEALGQWRDWLVWGLFLGLAGLSKYTAIFIALASGVCLLMAHGLRILRRPWPWVAVMLAIGLVSPVLLWNAQNQWVSFRYQGAHGAGGHWQVQEVLRFVLLQVLAFGPLLWWGLIGHGKPAALRLFFWLPALVLTVLAGGGTSMPHWTAPAWVALAPFAGVALARFSYSHGDQRRQRWRSKLLGLLAIVQGAACAALLCLMLAGGAPLFPRTLENTAVGANPFADLYGWDQAAPRAAALAQTQGLSNLSVQNWTLASRLAWYARPWPVHVLEPRFDQFSLWAGPLPMGASSLLVDVSLMPFELPLGAHGFVDCQLLETLDTQHFAQPLARFRFYACHGWAGDPQPRNKEPGP